MVLDQPHNVRGIALLHYAPRLCLRPRASTIFLLRAMRCAGRGCCFPHRGSPATTRVRPHSTFWHCGTLSKESRLNTPPCYTNAVVAGGNPPYLVFKAFLWNSDILVYAWFMRVVISQAQNFTCAWHVLSSCSDVVTQRRWTCYLAVIHRGRAEYELIYITNEAPLFKKLILKNYRPKTFEINSGVEPACAFTNA